MQNFSISYLSFPGTACVVPRQITVNIQDIDGIKLEA